MKLAIGRYWDGKNKIGCVIGELALLAGVNKKILIMLDENMCYDPPTRDMFAAIHQEFPLLGTTTLLNLQKFNDRGEFVKLEKLLGHDIVGRIESAQQKRK